MDRTNWVPFKFTSNEMYTLSKDKILAILQLFFFSISFLYLFISKKSQNTLNILHKTKIIFPPKIVNKKL